ncbi:cytochrome aa3 quinol oxidase subunit II [Gottfriedia solisilvae]|uniref:Quinol oxidase polypeptide II n=1 Tax=Gottfriedia solisilvae TaxID=1516104 RepID=A0A8J3APY7_9BACI|nr:cytochrome aa3 quinol oxidase subunit II [Gottfriedia solisilvae]GGI14747.1 quinol oxidase subunit 2 [Gottfriedia solisilvae]
MKKFLMSIMVMMIAVIMGACEKIAVLDPKGPVAKTQADTIIFSMLMMLGVLLVVYILFIVIINKYRASKLPEDYEPPHEEGSKWLEIIWTVIPVVIVTILSVVTVKTTTAVETVPKGHENDKTLVIYASSSNWKWHFSYPEQGIETVNYVNIPTNRHVEFRLYSFGPITSFWVPQLGGQKYAMSDMVTKLNFVASSEGSFIGKNSNFNGEGFAGMEFEVLAMSDNEFNSWVTDVKETAPALTEKEFDKLLEIEHLGRKTYTSTHLEFRPAPEGENAGHHHGSSDSESGTHDHHEMDMDMEGDK